MAYVNGNDDECERIVIPSNLRISAVNAPSLVRPPARRHTDVNTKQERKLYMGGSRHSILHAMGKLRDVDLIVASRALRNVILAQMDRIKQNRIAHV
jgi:hypothetical protein